MARKLLHDQAANLGDRCLKSAGFIMHAKAVSALVIGVFLVLAAVMTWEPAVHGAPGGQDALDDSRGINAQGVTSNPPAQADERGEYTRIVDTALAARLRTLEGAVERLDRTSELNALRARVAELERSMRNNHQGVANSAPRSQASDIAQLKNEIASIKRAQNQLTVQVANARNKSYPERSDLRVLQQKVFALENKVQRFDSR